MAAILWRLVAACLPCHALGKPVELWWQDEARIGQQGTLSRVWAERGSRPRAPRDQRYDWAYLFGAICPARDAGAALVLPHADAEAMNLHLIEIARRVTPGSHTVVILDGAGWHQTVGKLQVPNNISLLHRPPYSPALNPVENIWQYLRQNQLRQPRLHQLRCHPRSLLRSLERARCNARPHPFNRNTSLGVPPRLRFLANPEQISHLSALGPSAGVIAAMSLPAKSRQIPGDPA